jgi:electron transfer flavoprotein alpha subunit
VRLTRETDFGVEIFEAQPPLVVSVGAAPPGPIASTSPDGPIEVWGARDLVDDFRENDKRFGQTGSPTRVLAVRDSRPERKGLHTESVEEATRAILGLLAERKPETLSWEKPGHIAEIPGAHYDCWTVVELANGRPRRVSLELVARGRELAGKLGGKLVALLLGSGAEAAAHEAGRGGAEIVFTAEALGEYHPELWSHALRVVLDQHRPHVLLIPATGRGRDYGPRAAGELELGMTGDCVGVDIAKAGRLLQQKPAYGGNIVSVIMGATTPQLATVRPRMYEPLEPREEAEFEVRPLDVGPLPEPRVRLVERREESDSYLIDDADVVSLLGSGIGSPETIPRIEAAAAAAGAVVAGTRKVCEAGWLGRTRQVGLLGRPVAPRLLVAVGVHGDEEEQAGFVKAGVVVAVGAEANAPIRDAADVVVEGDWRQTLPPLHEAVAAEL